MEIDRRDKRRNEEVPNWLYNRKYHAYFSRCGSPPSPFLFLASETSRPISFCGCPASPCLDLTRLAPQIPVDRTELVPVSLELGFELHHAEKEYVMLNM